MVTSNVPGNPVKTSPLLNYRNLHGESITPYLNHPFIGSKGSGVPTLNNVIKCDKNVIKSHSEAFLTRGTSNCLLIDRKEGKDGDKEKREYVRKTLVEDYSINVVSGTESQKKPHLGQTL